MTRLIRSSRPCPAVVEASREATPAPRRRACRACRPVRAACRRASCAPLPCRYPQLCRATSPFHRARPVTLAFISYRAMPLHVERKPTNHDVYYYLALNS